MHHEMDVVGVVCDVKEPFSFIHYVVMSFWIDQKNV